MKTLFSFFCCIGSILLLPTDAHAAPKNCGERFHNLAPYRRLAPNERFQGKVILPDGRPIYVDITQGKPNKPILVLVNGLVYDTEKWDRLAQGLDGQGYTIIRYDSRGQSKTLDLAVKDGKDTYPEAGLQTSDLGDELNQLLEELGVARKVNVIGLSYGSSIAAEFATAHPEKVEQLVFMSPLVVSLENYDSNGKMATSWLNSVAMLWGKGAANAQYDSMYRNYVRSLPIPARQGVSVSQIQEALFQKIRAARAFDLRHYQFENLPAVHAIVASEESPAALQDQLAAWTGLSNQSRASLLLIKGASHDVPSSSPEAAALWLKKILSKKPAATVRGGFSIDPADLTVTPL